MKLIYRNVPHDFPPATTALACLEALQIPTGGVLALRLGGQVVELNAVIPHGGEIAPLTLQDEEGRRIYERSLRFVLLLAFRRLMPRQRVRIEHSVGGGVFLHAPGRELTPDDCAAIQAEMESIVAADLPFAKRKWALDDAIAYFAAEGQDDKVALLQHRPLPYFNMYECGGMWEYFYGAMTPSTGYVPVFHVMHLPGEGLALLIPNAENPDRPAEYIDRPKHYGVFAQSNRWCDILDIRNAPDLHRMMEKKSLRQFIRINEALHDKAIGDIAEAIVRGDKRIILVAGPSSSGKTTFTGRLAIHLQVLGLRPVQLSLDDYYLDRDALPREADGSIDLEALHTIDVPLFRRQMAQLLHGETVEVPRFSFPMGRRKEQGVMTHLDGDQPVLIEGIHGLNPALIEGLDEAVVHRVFVSALTCINLDDHNRIRTTDVRLLRRIVRDNQFRGTPPTETLSMWPSVRRGEETWIFPHQERADSMFNTALHYELPVLKKYAYDLLKAIPPEDPNRLTASRLVKLLNYFPMMGEDMMDEVPPLSLLREFVGGCTIDKE